ncbi:hypothetical protein [Rhodohalobacter sp. 614A]|uniref:hypothetical protein n=1 Tax=Rhodohalobacter sp. 614A TaxID=2908649 RepID=UPI001F44C0FA|nr:hypothetical protein [Rhodohalobacter sp. 614A]
MRFLKKILFPIIFTLVLISNGYSQQNSDPKGAFVRSLVVPGWGHYYVDHNEWRRGQIHLGAEVALIISYFGFSARADNLETQYETLASLEAGVDISGRSRTFRIAIGNFNTLTEYNDFQLRSRNWNRIFDAQAENKWNWETEDARNSYNDLRSDVDRVRNQLPAIFGLMVVNRVISAVSAYNRAKNHSKTPELSLLPVSTRSNGLGIVGKMNIRF